LGLRGWQWLFLIEGIPSIVLGAAALVVLTDRPEGAKWLTDEQRAWLVDRLRRDSATRDPSNQATPLRALIHPIVWLLASTNVLMSVPLWASAFWAPLLVRDALHTTPVMTGFVVAAIAATATVASLASASHSDRRSERCLHASVGASISAMGCAGVGLLRDPPAQVVALAAVEVGIRMYIPPFLCLTPMLLQGPAAAAAIGLVNTVFSIGGFVGPYLVGWFTDATGSSRSAFLVLAAMAASAAALCVALRREPSFAHSRQQPAGERS
jgi:ACS family tartrate transporter-like MFS transporter